MPDIQPGDVNVTLPSCDVTLTNPGIELINLTFTVILTDNDSSIQISPN